MDFINFLNDLMTAAGSTFIDMNSDLIFNVVKNSTIGLFKQAETSYYDSVAINNSPKTMKYVMDNASKINSSRRVTPPSYEEYVQYPHRNAKIINTRIGDVCLMIPPEFINIIESTSRSTVSAIRTGDMHTKNAYKKREIVMTVYFNGLEQINGYKVKSPIGDYYVDGLRSLLAQFKVTPFVPIINNLVNDTYGIYNVMLSNLTISTVQGYPNTFEVNISMLEVTLTPYLEVPDVIYHDMIDWDLFRYNYQRFLYDDKSVRTHFKSITDNSDSFEIYQIKTEALYGDNVANNSIFDEGNFELILSSEEELEIQSVSLSYQNTIPITKMSNYTTPVPQYVGKGTEQFVISMLSYSDEVVKKISNMSSYSAFLAKQYKEYGTFGFNKIKNQLLNMSGVDYIIIDKIEVNTVKGYPNLKQITILCTSFDVSQRDRENLVGFTPFGENAKGDKTDAINVGGQGMYNKIVQTNTIEKKLHNIELYPELELPTTKELDEHIRLVNDFRLKNNLKQLGITSYPRPFSLVPGQGPIGEYDGYADPDFYVFYPIKYSTLNDKIFDVFEGPSEIKNVTTVGRSVAFGDEPPEGYVYDKDGNLVGTEDMIRDSASNPNVDLSVLGAGATNNSLANLMLTRQGCGYVWAAHGQMYDATLRRQLEGQYGASNYEGTEKWYNKQVFDCSGIICWALRELGVASEGYRENNDGIFRRFCKTISKDELQPGDILNQPGVHIAVYIGDGKTIEAMSTDDGVRIGNLRSSFTQFGRISNLPKVVGLGAINGVNNSSNISNNSTSQQMPNIQTQAGNTEQVAKKIDRFLQGKLKNYGIEYCNICKKYGLNPYFIASISCQECGYGNSVSYNNVGGIMDWDNNFSTLRRFATISDCIESMGKTISSYVRQGLTTVEQVGNKYCPVGAANDPTGLNKNWISGVKNIYKQMTGEINVRVTEGTPTNTGGENSNSFSPNGAINGANAGFTPYMFKKNDNHGIVFGEKKADAIEKNFGIPIYKLSPINAIIIEEGIKNFGEEVGKFEMTNLGFKAGKPEEMQEEQSWFVDLLEMGTNSKSKFVIVTDMVGDIYNIENYNKYVQDFKSTEETIMNTMYCDYMMYNHRGKLLRAFPSMLFLLSDDGGDWLDGRKLWSNYYLYKSVIGASINQDRSYPAHTASISITNVHHNLDKKPKASEIQASIQNDPAYNELVVWLYKETGCLLGTPKLTDMMIDIKNKLYTSVNIKTGLNIHIRMGYGSNPLMLNTTFSGIVTDISIGETIEIIAQSYGLELVNNILSGDPKKINTVFTHGSEPSNVVTSVLTERDNWFTNSLNKKWGEASAYGIEHFGVPRGHEILEKNKEYDILKNVYYGRYDMRWFIDEIFGFEDEEDSSNFYLCNKTPWDLFQGVTQSLPEFICQPSYHQFECRLFFGLPHWLDKIRYDISQNESLKFENIDAFNQMQGGIYETAKTFAQFHYIDGMSDIVENNIQVNGEEIKTNCVPMYSLGGDVKSAPTVYSDRSIYASYQSTKVVDTTLNQNYIGPDWLWEKTFFQTGKNAAIKVGISNLLDGWNRAYDGEIVIIGDSSIKPCDYIMINDVYSTMSGLCGVREVTHKFDHTGFYTSIVPDMISLNTMKESGVGNVLKSLVATGASIMAVKSTRTAMLNICELFSRTISVSRKISGYRITNPDFYNSLGSPSVELNKTFKEYMNNGELILNTNGYIELTENVMQSISREAKANIKNSKYMFNELSEANSLIGGNSWYVDNILFAPSSNKLALYIGSYMFLSPVAIASSTILQGIIDEFSYNNCVKIFPLFYKNEPFVSSCKGQTRLIIGCSEDSELTMKDEYLEKDNENNDKAE